MWEIYDYATNEVVTLDCYREGMPPQPVNEFASREEAQGICDDLCEMSWAVRPTNKEDTMADLNRLYSDSVAGLEKARANPDRHGDEEDPDQFFMKHVVETIDGLLGDLGAEAAKRVAAEPLASAGESYKRDFMVVKYARGDYEN